MSDGIPEQSEFLRKDEESRGYINSILKQISLFLDKKDVLPTHMFPENTRKDDVYVTLLLINHLLRHPDSAATLLKKPDQSLERVISDCVARIDDTHVGRKGKRESPSHLAYFDREQHTIVSVKDDSPTMGLLLVRILLEIYSADSKGLLNENWHKELVSKMLEIACEEISAKQVGPTYGRDRYSGIAWCTLSEFPAIISAIDFLLDVLELARMKSKLLNPEQSERARAAITEGARYIVGSQREDHTWPVADMQKVLAYETTRKGREDQYWDTLTDYDERITNNPDWFNVSFSNTLDSTRVAVRVWHFLEGIKQGKETGKPHLEKSHQ